MSDSPLPLTESERTPLTIESRLCDDAGVADVATHNRACELVGRAPWTGEPFRCTGSFTDPGLTVRCTSPAHRAPVLSAEINALPGRVRYYIHDIETRCDPSGDVQTIWSLREQRDGLVLALEEARAALARVEEERDAAIRTVAAYECAARQTWLLGVSDQDHAAVVEERDAARAEAARLRAALTEAREVVADVAGRRLPARATGVPAADLLGRIDAALAGSGS